MTESNRLKVSVMVNIIAPARLCVYSGLADHFDLLLLYGKAENNRDAWRDQDKKIPNAMIKRVWGWQIRTASKRGQQVFDPRYLHLNPGFLWELFRFRPDAVITTEMGFRTILALIYGTLFRKSVFVWWGGTLHTERNRSRPRRILRFFLSRWARQWISYGQTSTQYLRSLGIPKAKILQIQNSVNESIFHADARAEFCLQPRPVVLHVGQFIARKGIDLLMTAAAILQKEGCEFSLLLVGSGPERQTLERRANDAGLKHVHFQSSRIPNEMPAIYRSADVLILPTLEDVWGLVANEAILAGLPVLCSQYAGCAHELFPEECIFDPENTTEFVTKLRDAIRGNLPKPDPSQLMRTGHIVAQLVSAIEGSVGARRTHSSTLVTQ